MENKYDIIIAGGGTAGCACAYISGMLGAKVLLVDNNSFLGGTMTSALVTPAMGTKTDKKINTDFFEKLMKKLNAIGGQITYSDGNIGWFNPELMKIALDNMMNEANVDVLFNTHILEVLKTKDKIKGVILDINNNKNDIDIETIYTNNTKNKKETLSEYIETNYLVDGTGDGKIFEKLNLKNLINTKKNKRNFQPASLRFIMSGINIKDFSAWIMELDKDRDVTSSCVCGEEIHLSTAYTTDSCRPWALEPIIRTGLDKGLIYTSDVNYFQLFTIPGMPESIVFNCPRTPYEVDPSDKPTVSKALMQARESILRLSDFMKKKFKGFEKAYISVIANDLGIRVSNRIRGKYVYTVEDLRSGKKFENPVLISKYPIDIHSSKKDGSVLEKQEIEYMLPVEALISEDFENLFAIGRCISADFEAQAALRIIPSCFSMGEGLAKYLFQK